MKKISFLLFLCAIIGTNSFSQVTRDLTYADGFKEGLLNGEYFKAQVISQHPEYGISFTWEYHKINLALPGGVEPAALAPGAPIANAVLIIGSIVDPSSLMVNLFTDPTIISAQQYFSDMYDASPSDYNYGLKCGFDARVSGKY